MPSCERLTPGAQCVSVTVNPSTASSARNLTTYSWTRSSPSIVAIPAWCPDSRRERAILAGAVPAVERRGNACGSCGADVRRVGRRARRALVRSATRSSPSKISSGLTPTRSTRSRGWLSQIPSKLLIVGTCCDGDWTGRRACSRAPAVGWGRVAAFGDAPARQLDARARGAVRRRAVWPECLSELAPAVHQATGGNPFMMVNAIDSLVARRLVVLEDERWRREASLDDIARALPETLADVIARNVDHLDPSEREALEAAAAVGLEFTAAAVADALQQKVEYVRRVLGPMAPAGIYSLLSARLQPPAQPVQGASRRPPTGSDTRSTPTSSRSRRRCFGNSGSSSASAASATSPSAISPSATPPAVPPEVVASPTASAL